MDALVACGIRKGDTVHVQSDLAKIGRVEVGFERENVLRFYEDAFREVVGPEGTISVFTLYTDYGRVGVPFHRERSPSQAGVFSEWLRTRSDAVRSQHPIVSISVVGARARDIGDGPHFSGYGYDSAWWRLYQAKPKFVALGLGINEGGSSFFHVIENAYGVPYLYTKVYDSPVYDHGRQIDGPFTLAVRYLDFGITYNTTPIKAAMVDQGLAKCLPLGGGGIFVVDGEVFFDHGIRLLRQNRYAFLREPPRFRRGEMPFDGPTGEFHRVYDRATR